MASCFAFSMSSGISLSMPVSFTFSICKAQYTALYSHALSVRGCGLLLSEFDVYFSFSVAGSPKINTFPKGVRRLPGSAGCSLSSCWLSLYSSSLVLHVRASSRYSLATCFFAFKAFSAFASFVLASFSSCASLPASSACLTAVFNSSCSFCATSRCSGELDGLLLEELELEELELFSELFCVIFCYRRSRIMSSLGTPLSSLKQSLLLRSRFGFSSASAGVSL